MTITLNGAPTEIADGLEKFSLSTLLDTLGFSGKPIVVEHNKEAIFPRDYDKTFVQDGDQLEIISIAAGG